MIKLKQIFTNQDSFQTPPNTLDLGRRVLSTNLALKPTESLLIITDPAMVGVEGALWFEAGKTITPQTTMMVIEGMTQNAQEPPAEVIDAMKNADVAIMQTTYSLSHTQARIAACSTSTRAASLPNADLDLLTRTLNIDFAALKPLTEKIATLLTNASTATITSPGGTNLTMSIDGRIGDPDTGDLTKKGAFGNLPSGEAYLAPIEGSAQGVYVVDGSFAGIPLDSPITITVKNGLATDISGGSAAQTLIQKLEEVGPLARNLAELGIGTNPNANPKASKLLEAEKAYGTVHIALGANATFGGTVSVPFHSDGVILSPTLLLDNQVIIKDGEFNL